MFSWRSKKTISSFCLFHWKKTTTTKIHIKHININKQKQQQVSHLETCSCHKQEIALPLALYNPFHHSTPATKYAVFDLHQYQSSDNAGVQTSSPIAEDKKNDCKLQKLCFRTQDMGSCLFNLWLSLSFPLFVCLFVLRFYGPVNPMGSCRARSVYLTTCLLGRLSPLSG